jgi:hypothetical protein
MKEEGVEKKKNKLAVISFILTIALILLSTVVGGFAYFTITSDPSSFATAGILASIMNYLWFIPLILSIIAIVQIKKNDEKGMSYAISALIINAVILLFPLIGKLVLGI